LQALMHHIKEAYLLWRLRDAEANVDLYMHDPESVPERLAQYEAQLRRIRLELKALKDAQP
jgi:hypothetical protein